MGDLADPHVELHLFVALPERVLPGRAGTRPGCAVRPRLRSGLEAPRPHLRRGDRDGDGRRRGRLCRLSGARERRSSWLDRHDERPRRGGGGGLPGRVPAAGSATAERGAGLGLAALASCSAARGRRRPRWPTAWDPSTRPTSRRQSQRRNSSAGPAPSRAGHPSPPTRRASPPRRASRRTQTSAQADNQVLASGREFLPVGGFSGQVPSTPLPVFIEDVRHGASSDVLVPVKPLTRNPDMRWVLAHCSLRTGPGASVHTGTAVDDQYRCAPSDAAGSG